MESNIFKKIGVYGGLLFAVSIFSFGLISALTKKTEEVTIKFSYNGKSTSTKNISESVESSKVVNNILSPKIAADTNSVEMYADEIAEVPLELSNEYTGNELFDLYDNKGNFVHWIYDTRIETTDYNNLVGNIANVLSSVEGYVESSDVYENSTLTTKGEEIKARRGFFVIRVPEENKDEIDKVLEGNGKVVSASSKGEDNTESYIDAKTQLEALNIERDKLKDLLVGAENIQDILAINDRLAEIEQRQNYYDEIKKNIEKDVAFATYNLTIDEVVYYKDTVEKYSSDVSESWGEAFKTWFRDYLPIIFLFTISALPIILIIAIVVYKTSKKIVDYKYFQKIDE